MLDVEAIALRRAEEQCAALSLPVELRAGDSWRITKGRGEHRGGRKGSLSDDTVRLVRSMRSEGATYSAITRATGASKGVVQQILAGRIYRGVR